MPSIKVELYCMLKAGCKIKHRYAKVRNGPREFRKIREPLIDVKFPDGFMHSFSSLNVDGRYHVVAMTTVPNNDLNLIPRLQDFSVPYENL